MSSWSKVGCPESGIDEAVARLVAAGYKVRGCHETKCLSHHCTDELDTCNASKSKRVRKAHPRVCAGVRCSGVHSALELCSCGAAARQVARVEQMETAAEAKAARGPKATIRREMTRVHTPATATGNIGADAARSITPALRVRQYLVSAVLLCKVHDMAVVSCKLQYPTSAYPMVGFVAIAGRRGRQGYQGGRAFSVLP